MAGKKVLLTAFEVEEVLQAIGGKRNDINGSCAKSLNDECDCTTMFSMGTMVTSDEETIHVDFCEDCSSITYYYISE